MLLALAVTGLPPAARSAEGEAGPRIISLKGAANFRDIGGYSTVDGLTVRHGVVYRSDHLHDLAESDWGEVGDLDIDVVFDLRRDAERNQVAES